MLASGLFLRPLVGLDVVFSLEGGRSVILGRSKKYGFWGCLVFFSVFVCCFVLYVLLPYFVTCGWTLSMGRGGGHIGVLRFVDGLNI